MHADRERQFFVQLTGGMRGLPHLLERPEASCQTSLFDERLLVDSFAGSCSNWSARMKLHIFFPVLAAAVCWLSAEALARSTGTIQKRIHSIIVHTISGPSCSKDRVVFSGAPGDADGWKRFFDKQPFLGIHYIVDREGNVASGIPENQIANHALGNNEGTIGIELVHNGDGIEEFGRKQIDALINLVKSIRSRHNIKVEDIKSHGDVDSRTLICAKQPVKARQDPGANFPWAQLRDALNERSEKQ